MPGDLVQLDHRCYRGEHCSERKRINGAFQPVEIAAFRGLCVTDTSQLRWAIEDMSRLYQELGDVLSDEPTKGGGGEKVSHTASLQVPLDLHIQALQAEIDHELLCWADPVAERLGISWDMESMRNRRPHTRIAVSAHLLAHALPVLLSLREVAKLTWTTTDERPATVERDGLDGALELLHLHRRARQGAGYRGDVHTMPTPCPRCERTTLQRRDGAELVTCAYCRQTWSWDDYQEICHGVLTAA
jgi:hypothetical protein